ncbi:hypothetical protein [Gemmata sp.]|uniref:hypothetical protein n=1 Tax=Gemmata sp. TaxID=1914242 RepID=UPI003F6FAD61
MNIPVLLEPIPTGFRATTGAPLNLAAEAGTASDALRAVEGLLAALHTRGARIVEVAVTSTDPTMERIRELTASMAANPMFDDWVAETKKYRKQREAEEDAAEAAAEAEKLRSSSNGTTNTHRQEPAA